MGPNTSLRCSDGTFDCHYAFVDLGGLTIANAESSEAIFDMILDYPLYPFFEWEVTALCNWEQSYDKNIEYFKRGLSGFPNTNLTNKYY